MISYYHWCSKYYTWNPNEVWTIWHPSVVSTIQRTCNFIRNQNDSSQKYDRWQEMRISRDPLIHVHSSCHVGFKFCRSQNLSDLKPCFSPCCTELGIPRCWTNLKKKSVGYICPLHSHLNQSYHNTISYYLDGYIHALCYFFAWKYATVPIFLNWASQNHKIGKIDGFSYNPISFIGSNGSMNSAIPVFPPHQSQFFLSHKSPLGW